MFITFKNKQTLLITLICCYCYSLRPFRCLPLLLLLLLPRCQKYHSFQFEALHAIPSWCENQETKQGEEAACKEPPKNVLAKLSSRAKHEKGIFTFSMSLHVCTDTISIPLQNKKFIKAYMRSSKNTAFYKIANDNTNF